MPAFTAEVERALDRASRVLRLSPFDSWLSMAFIASSLGHCHLSHFKETTATAQKAIQCVPAYSLAYIVLAPPLVRMRWLDQAKAAAARGLELQPKFRFRQHFTTAGHARALAGSLTKALCAAGLLE